MSAAIAMVLTGPEPIAAHHVLNGFDCERPALDGWLITRALRNEREFGSRTYVVREEGAVAACYSLSTGAVERRVAPGRPDVTRFSRETEPPQ